MDKVDVQTMEHCSALKRNELSHERYSGNKYVLLSRKVNMKRSRNMIPAIRYSRKGKTKGDS